MEDFEINVLIYWIRCSCGIVRQRITNAAANIGGGWRYVRAVSHCSPAGGDIYSYKTNCLRVCVCGCSEWDTSLLTEYCTECIVYYTVH